MRLLDESGDGRPYTRPSTTYVRSDDVNDRRRYLRLNTRLWTEGHVQSMSAKALAMLLVILEEQYGKYDQPTWWTKQIFTDRFHLSSATRSEGGQELFRRQLVVIKRAPVTPSGAAFATERVRNTYRVIGPAVPENWTDPTTSAGKKAPTRTKPAGKRRLKRAV